MAVVTDKKIPVDSNEDGTIDYYAADIVKATDYAPFGMGLVDRSFNAESYRYGYNGKENDEETGLQDYGFRIYYPGLGRFLSVDPLSKTFPWYTPYQFAGNKPIESIDLDGAEEMHYTWIENENGELALTLIEEKAIIERVIESYRPGRSLYNDAAVPQYKTIVNNKKVYILHTVHRAPRDKHGGLNPLEPQEWVDYPVRIEYESFEDLKNARNGKRSTSDFFAMSFDRYGAAIKSENAAMPAGGMGNLKAGKSGRGAVVPLVDDVAKTGFSSFKNLDDLAGLFKGKNLSNSLDDLLNSGWIRVEGSWGSKTVFQKQIGKDRFYAIWESANMNHSTNNLPTSYWKLTKGKISAYGDNVRRVSDAPNFKHEKNEK